MAADSLISTRTTIVVVSCLAGGVLLSGLYATTGVGLPCPFRAMTGWNCPLCGGTRMGAALLHGDIATAWAANPAVLVALLLVVLLLAAGTVERRTGRGGLGRRVRSASSAVPVWVWLVSGGLATAAYTVARNLA